MESMPSDLSTLLRATIEHELPALLAVSDAAASLHPTPDAWSPKEELGHLIDSATNNHVRFVLAAIQPELRGPSYAQNEWVSLHGYDSMPWNRIVDFWFSYNMLLVDLIARIPAEKLSLTCMVGDGPACTLAFLIEDYVLHLKHHVDHMLQREKITVYPSQKAASAR